MLLLGRSNGSAGKKALPHKPGGLNSIPGAQIEVGGENQLHTCALPPTCAHMYTITMKKCCSSVPLFPLPLSPAVTVTHIYISINAPNSTTCCNDDLTSAIVHCCNYIFAICLYFLGLWKFYYHSPPLCCCWQLFTAFPILETQRYITSVYYFYIVKLKSVNKKRETVDLQCLLQLHNYSSAPFGLSSLLRPPLSDWRISFAISCEVGWLVVDLVFVYFGVFLLDFHF